MQLIPDQEDREFTSSMGHWTGDGYWYEGPYLDKTGMIAVDLEDDEEEKTIALSYPHIALMKERRIWFTEIESGKAPADFGARVELWIDDGTNSMEIETVLTNQTTWTDPSEVLLFLGPEWDIETLTLYAKVTKMTGDPFTYFFKGFSAIPESVKTDHLPLMGVH